MVASRRAPQIRRHHRPGNPAMSHRRSKPEKSHQNPFPKDFPNPPPFYLSSSWTPRPAPKRGLSPSSAAPAPRRDRSLLLNVAANNSPERLVTSTPPSLPLDAARLAPPHVCQLARHRIATRQVPSNNPDAATPLLRRESRPANHGHTGRTAIDSRTSSACLARPRYRLSRGYKRTPPFSASHRTSPATSGALSSSAAPPPEPSLPQSARRRRSSLHEPSPPKVRSGMGCPRPPLRFAPPPGRRRGQDRR
jgi:hypothetical protein